MPKSSKMLSTDLIKLKPETFYYCDKMYVQRRFISRDCKLVIIQDDIRYVSCYKADKNGLGVKIDDDGFYYKNCQSAYPHYDIQTALDMINNLGITFEHEFKINPSHYNRRRPRIV